MEGRKKKKKKLRSKIPSKLYISKLCDTYFDRAYYYGGAELIGPARYTRKTSRYIFNHFY